MRDSLLLAKILVVSGEVLLGPEYDKYFVDSQNMYLFVSSAYYDPISGRYTGAWKLHDTMIEDLGLPELPPGLVNYISVDLDSKNRRHTKLILNRRGYQLSPEQIAYIEDEFDVG